MINKGKTIFELFKDYSVEEVTNVISSLNDIDKCIIKEKFGNDLHKAIKEVTLSDSKEIYIRDILIVKINILLIRGSKRDETIRPELTSITTKDSKVISDDTQSKLLELIKKDISSNELREKLNLSTSQLYEELVKLKNRGVAYAKSYHSDGTIHYETSIKSVKGLTPPDQDRTIITDNRKNKMKFLLISDLHFGSALERPDLVDRAFNYCKREGINIILCGGDLIDGTFSKIPKKIENVYDQIEYFINTYPSDPSILTFSVGGDHDLSALTGCSINIIEACENCRQDVIIGSFNNMNVNVKKDKIHLYHHVFKGFMKKSNASIILHGHSHTYSSGLENKALHITIPALCEIRQPMPSVLELEVKFKNGRISNAIVKHIYFGSQDILLGETVYDFDAKKQFYNNGITSVETEETEENITEEPKENVEVNDYHGKERTRESQIEKFNKRFMKK